MLLGHFIISGTPCHDISFVLNKIALLNLTSVFTIHLVTSVFHNSLAPFQLSSQFLEINKNCNGREVSRPFFCLISHLPRFLTYQKLSNH